jgi:hypothetical protein
LPSSKHLWCARRALEPVEAKASSVQAVAIVKDSATETGAGRMRKYELYLPLKHNNGRRIDLRKLRAIKEELLENFGAITVSSLTAPYQGRWKYCGVEYIDDIIKIEVVTTRDRRTKKFFTEFKERLKTSLRQIDILITTHGIQVI